MWAIGEAQPALFTSTSSAPNLRERPLEQPLDVVLLRHVGRDDEHVGRAGLTARLRVRLELVPADRAARTTLAPSLREPGRDAVPIPLDEPVTIDDLAA